MLLVSIWVSPQLPVVTGNGSSDDASSELFSSASQESAPEGETSLECQPTPEVQHKVYYLNNFLRNSGDGRVSPIRSQLCTDALKVSSSAVATTSLKQCTQ